MSKVTEDTKKKINLKKLLIAVIIAIVVILGIFFAIYMMGRPCDRTNNTYTEITIEDDDSTSEIASNLKDAGVIKDESSFITLSSILMKNGKYKPGIYLLSPCMDFNRIANTMIKGITTSSGFTIPAGYTIDQTFNALDQAGIVSKDELNEVVNSVDFSSFGFIDPNVDKSKQLEGFLYPDRYDIGDDANAMMIITTMLDKFDNTFNDEFKARTEELGLSVRDVIIIASIIEKATTVDKEKNSISSVIHNRINLGMPFKNGYPQDPLCSPGIASIKAALYPEESENLYYVLSDKLNGTHVFVQTKEEYIEMLDKYKLAKASSEESNE